MWMLTRRNERVNCVRRSWIEHYTWILVSTTVAWRISTKAEIVPAERWSFQHGFKTSSVCAREPQVLTCESVCNMVDASVDGQRVLLWFTRLCVLSEFKPTWYGHWLFHDTALDQCEEHAWINHYLRGRGSSFAWCLNCDDVIWIWALRKLRWSTKNHLKSILVQRDRIKWHRHHSIKAASLVGAEIASIRHHGFRLASPTKLSSNFDKLLSRWPTLRTSLHVCMMIVT